MSWKSNSRSPYPPDWRSFPRKRRINQITLVRDREPLLEEMREHFDLESTGTRLDSEMRATLVDAVTDTPPLALSPEADQEDRVEVLRRRWGREELASMLAEAIDYPGDVDGEYMPLEVVAYIYDELFEELEDSGATPA